MDANRERALEYQLRGAEDVVSINKLVASVCTGAVVLSIHELDLLKHAPVRIVLLTLATVSFGLAAILLLASMRYFSKILAEVATLVREQTASEPVEKQLEELAKDHDGFMRAGSWSFVVAIVFSCAFVVAQACAALR